MKEKQKKECQVRKAVILYQFLYSRFQHRRNNRIGIEKKSMLGSFACCSEPLQFVSSKQTTLRWNSIIYFLPSFSDACRTSMPLVAPNVAQSLQWSKTEVRIFSNLSVHFLISNTIYLQVGTILSSFFWGYCLTQILGGFLSDRYTVSSMKTFALHMTSF